MTFAHFVVKNSFRNPRRTALTVTSIGFSLFLLIMLHTILDILINPPMTQDSELRLAVQRSTALSDQMPMAYEQKLVTVPNVKLVMPLQWFGGYWKEAKNFFANFACDQTKLFAMFPELIVSDAVKAAFQNEKSSCIVGRELAETYGWKVGETITLKGTIFPTDAELKIVGLYEFNGSQGKRNLYFRFDYLNELLGEPNTIGTFWLLAKDPDSIPGIIEYVDSMFKNSTAETKTQTEKSFILGFASMLGNVRVLIGSIALVVVFTMLLVAASTMAMTIRERMREVGILKSMGYQARTILGLILGEAAFISLLGGLVAASCSFALRFIDIYKMTQGFVQELKIDATGYGIAIGVGLAIGIASGFIPAIQASRIPITQALRRLD